MEQTVYAVDDPADLDAEKAAFELFPLLTTTTNTVLRKEYAAALADMIGTPGEFHAYLTGSAGEIAVRQERLFTIFKHNVRLLVEKTWVDGHDQKRKARTIANLDALADAAATGNYPAALRQLVNISDSIAVLLFGETPSDNGFMDYIFRIDPKLGIFYWYAGCLHDQHPVDAELSRLELLIGVYALASF
jgi:hypothetical protein